MHHLHLHLHHLHLHLHHQHLHLHLHLHLQVSGYSTGLGALLGAVRATPTVDLWCCVCSHCSVC